MKYSTGGATSNIREIRKRARNHPCTYTRTNGLERFYGQNDREIDQKFKPKLE